MATLFSVVRRKIKDVGLKRTIRDLANKLAESFHPKRLRIRRVGESFDRECQVDTTRVLPAVALDVSDEAARQAARYEPTPIDQFLGMMDELAVDPGKFVFVDIGSGKGRTLMLASRFPFKRILGIEFSRKLCAIAERNVKAFKRKSAPACADIEVVCADARSFEPPPDPCVLYFYNPFSCETFGECLANIERSLAQGYREMILLYLNPVCHSVVERSGRFVLLKRIEDRRFLFPYHVYASRAAGTRA